MRAHWKVELHIFHILCARAEESVKQLLLEEYLEPRRFEEISYRKIIDTTRACCRGFYSGDIAKLVALQLSREGIKIWR